MQIRHLKTIQSPTDPPLRVTALAWTPSNQKLAVATSDRVIQLFDETGERKDRFATKPGDPKAPKPYYICGLVFSPDSTKLAVAQSDNAVFVYRLGLEWGEKKSIVNKYIQNAEITCLAWPREQPNAIVFGMMDGKVRMGNLKTNKAATLYQADTCVLSIASSLDGHAIISSHMDGSINRFFFDDGISGASQGKFAFYKGAPIAIGWGESIVVAGNDKTIAFYDNDGRVLQEFDYSRDEEEQDFTVAEFSPSGQSVVVGGLNRFYVFNFSTTSGQWEEAPAKIIENFYVTTALSWKPDGSRLVAGNMSGAVELFDCCLRRSRYKGKFEFTYVSPSQVIVKRLSTGSRIVLKSHYGYEIEKVNIFRNQYLIANTADTLLMGDLATCKLSEIPWQNTGQERYYFENPNVCMVFNAGELSLVEYGVNEILGSCRTEYTSPHLVSVRINERKADEDIKKVAYLIDLQTIDILDLNTGIKVATMSHDCRVDWLELSGKANKLLFRDKKRQLHLYDVASQRRTTLLNFCSYVQWVPYSDVVVAQNRGNLCIWYSIDSPERVTMFPIKGEVEDIERADGKTEVIVDEGVNTVSYTLDEGLIEFGTALDDKDYDRAVGLLETLELTPETEAMWKSLSQVALKDRDLAIAERCFAALGDVASTRYLHQISVMTEETFQNQHGDAVQHYAVKARLAMLDKHFKIAEAIFLDQGKIDEAMNMYQTLHQWELSIKLAESKNHPQLETLKRNYLQWLLESGQEDKAGELKEADGDTTAAINLYLKAGMPARAANLLQSSQLLSNSDLTERVADALLRQGLYEKAGELLEKLGHSERALDAYKRGKVFRCAIELARTMFPQEVVNLEEQWGDYLVSCKRTDNAISHYIEAGKSLKAVEAAISARQWKKAVAIVDSLQPPEKGQPYFLRLAAHFAENHEYQLAERYYVMAAKPQEAVEMYTRASRWENAHALATTYMSADEVALLYISQARDLENQGNLKDAEKIYLTVKEPDLAINMYKNHRLYDDMIRLVTAHHKDLLIETHLYLAKTLETEGNLKQAEQHYIEGQDWKSAINMYCASSMYEDAYRIAKAYGGPSASKQVAYLWARSLGGESAVKLLSKLGLLDAAIDFATENGAFEFAFELSRFADKFKLADVHYKHAMFLEDEGRFKEAQQAFELAGKPKEAILMYIHNEDWDAALRVAEVYDPGSLPEVLVGQARVAFDRGDYAKAEALLLRAQHPEVAVKLYRDKKMWKEALQFAKEYLPSKVAEINIEHENSKLGNNVDGGGDMLKAARIAEQQQNHSQAVDLYLNLSPNFLGDADALQEAWEKAVELAVKFTPERGRTVIEAVCAKLSSINRHGVAADLYTGMEMYKEAIDAYIMGGLWEKARQLLVFAPTYSAYVENAYAAHLKTGGYTDALVAVDAIAALDTYARREEWDRCLETAQAQGMPALAKYVNIYAGSMLKQQRYGELLSKIVRYRIPLSSESSDMYSRISSEILRTGHSEDIHVLRDLLWDLVNEVPTMADDSLSEYLLIAHLHALRQYCSQKKGLAYFAAKQSISLLRYTDILPPDRIFFEAGEAAKECGMTNMAFLCWNRFLDISDAIDEGEATLQDSRDFADTDIPSEVELPLQSITSNKREEVRDWVLQLSLDQQVKRDLNRRQCGSCGEDIYEAALSCRNCQYIWAPCIVTGYPILQSSVNCTSCNRAANKDDWNKYVASEKACPWCRKQQNPQYFA
ncbi:hypothetical protein BC832DRAFT_563653 [Gaertneriomyces semiglobifer]|nr:hypothetical protein BC832DRAFT_563653 [Gaertneriomyces semiglobifer]